MNIDINVSSDIKNRMMPIIAETNLNYHPSRKVQIQPGKISNYYYGERAFQICEFS